MGPRYAVRLRAAVIAALVTRIRTSTLTSYVLHFAVGLIIGFVLGTAFMLAQRGLLIQVGHDNAQAPVTSAINVRLVTALAVVVLIDGAIIGVALSVGGSAALLIAIALSIELLFVAVMMPIGTVLGAVLFARVSAPLLIAGLAFGAAALLCTAIAELLVEADEIKENAGTIAMLAAGFLLFLILKMLL